MDERDKLNLIYIRENCLSIFDAIDFFGISKESFIKVEHYQALMSTYLLRIGEKSNLLSEAVKEQAGEKIVWHRVRGLRNIAAHAYERLDMETVWDVIITHIPILLDFCEVQLDIVE